MTNKIATLLLGFGLITGPSSLVAADPVVVELFTSQGCYSCPPAEAYLGDLSKNPEVVALEFHVDYWDDLVHGAAGKWKDVFSKPEFTQRQRIYAGNLPKGQVYTPQMVVGGDRFAVGSNRRAVKRLIAQAKEKQNRTSISLTQNTNNELVADIRGTSNRPMSLWLVRFMKNVETRVRAGENKGKKLTSHNIVTKVERLSEWQGNPAQLKFEIKNIKATESCAVLLQEDAQGPIYGAALCPPTLISG
jgi:hypothetical protein